MRPGIIRGNPMKIEAANLCAESGEIVERAEGICPKCLSSQFLVLTSLISRAHREFLRKLLGVKAS